MILKVFCLLQFILIQVNSAQISNRDLLLQNALNKLANTPLTDYGRCRRQINNPPVGLPGGNLAANDCNCMPFRNSLPNGNFLRSNGLPSNLDLKNVLPNNFALNNGLPNNFQFPNMNDMTQNRLLPSYNDIIINGLPFNNVPNELPPINNGLPGLNNVPNGLAGFNNLLSGLNNVPTGLPSMNNGLPSFNNVPNGLPSFNNVPTGLPSFNNGLPGLNNVPNGLPTFNNVPTGFPSVNNGWPSQINLPKRLPGLNNVPNELPGINNMPNGLPGINNMPNGFPGLNIVPSGLPNLNNNPTFTNNALNLNNVPTGSNILNLNNLPAENTLPNINNIAILNGSPSFNNLPCNNLPVSTGLPLNNLPSANILPSINNQLPYLSNFRITEIGIGNGVADINRFPRDNQPVDNMPSYVTQNANEFRQQVADELTNMNNFQNNNAFLSNANMPSANVLPSIVPVEHRFSSVSHFSINSGLPNIGNDVQNINNVHLNNDLPDVSHFQNYNPMPANEQRFVNNIPFNNDFAVPNNFPENTGMPNTNSGMMNAIDGMAFYNEGHLNDILLAKRSLLEPYSQNSDVSGFSSNDFQFSNIQVPDNHWHYEFVPSKVPANQNSLQSEGMQMFSNVPNEYSSVLTSNNLNLAQELVKNLQIEGLANMPFLNGLPVAGITETVTVLNGPYSK